MTNIEILSDAMDEYIIKYRNTQSGQMPPIQGIMFVILKELPADVRFTLDDIHEVASDFAWRYESYYTYDEWYNTMAIYLADYTITAPADGVIPPDESNTGKTILVIGGAIVLVALLGMS
jgi:hypothetical protein